MRKPATQTTRESFDAELQGYELTIEFTRNTVFGRDHYGADADGNRGIWVDCIDEDYESDVLVTIGEGEPSPLSQLPMLKQAVDEAITNWFETHQPEYLGYDERDPDEERDFEEDR